MNAGVRIPVGLPLSVLNLRQFKTTCYTSAVTKICGRCQEPKPLEAFARRRGNQRVSYCKECNKAYQQQHYADNRSAYAERRRQQRYEYQQRIDALKDRPCTDCGNRFPPCAMDFDHVTGEKVAGISRLLADAAWATLLAELEKTELVCACCHRIRTQRRNPAQFRI